MSRACGRLAGVLVSLAVSGLASTRTLAGDERGAVELDDLDPPRSVMRGVIERYVADRGSLSRSHPVPDSPARRERMGRFDRDWLAALAKLDFDEMDRDDRIDYVLF